jgi:hypothetical protein
LTTKRVTAASWAPAERPKGDLGALPPRNPVDVLPPCGGTDSIADFLPKDCADAWLVTHTGDALNTEHVKRLYTDKTKVKAVLAGFPVNVAVDLAPDATQRILRDIIDGVVQGWSVEVVGQEVRRLTSLR